MSKLPRILLVIAHYFRAEDNSQYSSTSADQRAQRRLALERSLQAWRSLFGAYRFLQWSTKRFAVRPAPAELDIVVLVHEDNHLLDPQLTEKYQLQPHPVLAENPRMLPFGAHLLVRMHAEAYDWFIYAEDDLLPHDGAMLRKQALFQERFGLHRLLQPNRFEINGNNRLAKTYIDGDLPPNQVRALWSHVQEDELQLTLATDLGEVRCVRASNPHTGLFMLSRAQAQHWVKQPHFFDLDCSFVSPLESAGSLSLLKTFSIYKPLLPADFLEVEHQDQKFSSYDWPEFAQKFRARPPAS